MLEFSHHSFSTGVGANAPGIYFIIKGYLLYIGETQRTPLVRWAEHFGVQGTFYSKVREFDPELLESPSPILCFGFTCVDMLKACSGVQLKRACRYVEHEVHLRAYEHPGIAKKYRIVSDTSRSAPGTNPYGNAKALSVELIARFCIELERVQGMHRDMV